MNFEFLKQELKAEITAFLNNLGYDKIDFNEPTPTGMIINEGRDYLVVDIWTNTPAHRTHIDLIIFESLLATMRRYSSRHTGLGFVGEVINLSDPEWFEKFKAFVFKYRDGTS